MHTAVVDGGVDVLGDVLCPLSSGDLWSVDGDDGWLARRCGCWGSCAHIYS